MGGKGPDTEMSRVGRGLKRGTKHASRGTTAFACLAYGAGLTLLVRSEDSGLDEV